MAIWKRPNLPVGPLRDLNETLHGLRERSGLSSRQIADAMRRQHGIAPSHTTIYQLFTQPRLPPADLVLRVAEVLVAAQPHRPANAHDRLLDLVDHLWQQAAQNQRLQPSAEQPPITTGDPAGPAHPAMSVPAPTSSPPSSRQQQPASTPAGTQTGALAADSATVLDDLAAKCTDSPLRPGQYRYFEHRFCGGSWGYDDVFEMWIPHDQTHEWMLRTHQDPNDPEAAQEKRAQGAGFIDLGSSFGPWGSPTPQFYAELPRDPRALYDQLLIDETGRPDPTTIVYRLRSITRLPLPADLRAALLRALRYYHPTIQVRTFARTIDGQPAVSLSLPFPASNSRMSLLFDPNDCHILGSQIEEAGGIIQIVSVRLATVDAIGQLVVCTTSIGASNTCAVGNLRPGTKTLSLTAVIAPDNVGTYEIILGNGLTFSDGSTRRSGTIPQGGVAAYSIIVPSS